MQVIEDRLSTKKNGAVVKSGFRMLVFLCFAFRIEPYECVIVGQRVSDSYDLPVSLFLDIGSG